MNERIKELIEQATKHYPATPSSGEFSTFDKEKFAELIVRECVAICEDTEGDPSADSRWGRRCCALEIREHFGVEE
jgi:hypothetical protein